MPVFGYSGQTITPSQNGIGQPAWYTFPRIDNYGGKEPYGNFPKPDSNILCPAGYPITALLPGVVSGINAPDGTIPDWGAVVTIRLDVPYNPIATHTAYLHLANVAQGLRVGQHVESGQLIGYNGGIEAAGAQKADVGFALYNGDYYGYGSSWSQYVGSASLNPVPLLNQFAQTGGTTNYSSSQGSQGQSGWIPGLARVAAVFQANGDVASTLMAMDTALALTNPFNVDLSTIPDITIVGQDTGLKNPLDYWIQVAVNIQQDSAAMWGRIIFALLGGMILYKVASAFIDFGAIYETAKAGAEGLGETVGKVAMLL